MRCQTCGTDTPGASPTHICQHCGHQLGAAESVADRILEVLERLTHHIDPAERARRRAAEIAQAFPQDSSWAVPIPIPTPTATNTVDLGAPSQGRVWEVRRLVMGGDAATTVAPGAGYVHKQGTEPTELNLANLADFAPTLPNVAFYGSHEFVVRGGEHLWASIVGGTAGQQYVCAIQVEDWAEAYYNNPRIDLG